MRCAHPGLVAILLLSSTAFGQLRQKSPKLVGAGSAGEAYQGTSVSLSADGKTAIVGGYCESGIGSARVWTRSGDVWAQQGGQLVGTGAVGASCQGRSVSLSGDGNTAIVGGSGDDGGIGAAWVWTRSGDVWTQQGGKLVGSGAAGTAGQGGSVALSADGNTAIVGGGWDDHGTGAVWVWTRLGGVWTQQGGKLVGSGALGYAYQGGAVALSADGSGAIVSGEGDSDFVGAVWVWVRSGGVWAQQGSKLVGTGATAGGGLGGVALSADGSTAMAGGPGNGGGVGATWVWTRSGGVWTQQGDKLVGSDAVGTSHQGGAVSLSADGSTAIIGGLGDSEYLGAAWVWTRSGGVWTQQGSKLVGSGAASYTYIGSSVALSAGGDTAIVGGPGDSGRVGAAWVFTSALSFYPLAPCRVLDTRNPDGPLGGPALAAAGSRLFTMTGACGVPTDARALSANVTVAQPAATGTLVLHEGDVPTPAVLTISFRAGLTRANNALLHLATDGSGTANVANESAGSVHVIVDVNGYFR